MKKYKIAILLLLLPMIGFSQWNQYDPSDSLKEQYPYRLPIFGNFLHDVGVDLPYPMGIMVNSYMAQQKILITDIAIGVEGGQGEDIPLTDITRLIEFEDVEASAYSLSFRPDIWVLPFLNVYGIVGKAWTKTDVVISYPVNINAIAELNGMSFGVGMTFAGGYKNYFFILDMNNTWSYMSNFEQPVKAEVLSPRIGRTWKLKKPESNFGIWVGAMRIGLGGVTEGSIKLQDVLPQETWDNKDQKVQDYYDWYNGLDENKQNAADQLLTPIVERLEAGNGETTILYSIVKEAKEEWNMLVGGQYQINKHWQIRTEFGFLGERTSWLLSVNYRLGFKIIK